MKNEKVKSKNNKTMTHFFEKKTCNPLHFCIYILVFTFYLLPSTSHAQWYTGMSQKTSLALCIHLTDTAAELYSPMQTMDPIPVSKWSLDGDKLDIECKSIGLKISLSRQNISPCKEGEDCPDWVEKTIAWQGYWKQGFLKEDITFYPTDTIFQLRRPQTPEPPYRFDEETVTTDYTDSQGNKVHLEGTLTYPKDGDRHPCIVLVSGSGQQNRDEEIMQHRPFLVIADYMASRGIAVLRYDDRGVGASTGNIDNGTTALYSEDAEAMFNAVKGNAHIDPKRFGIGGHSEGGAIAPMVAARNKDVKFVVMLAGQGCSGLDVLLQQNEAIYRAGGVSDSLVAIRVACMRELFSLPAGSSQKSYKTIIARHTAGLTKEQTDSIGLGRGTAAALKQQMDLPWMQAFLRLDPAEYLPKVTCPILALNGWKDCQVLCEPNQQRISQLTGGRAVCIQLRWLNHLFQHCTTGSPNEYILIEETFDEDAMTTIADWILGL